jgi:hypothetical protein
MLLKLFLLAIVFAIPELTSSRSVDVFCMNSLNKQQALQKKIKNCNSNHMTITMKQGNNLVIELSTAAYEVFRTELILRINTFLNSNYAVNYEPRYDEQEFIVEETYKVHRKRNDGNIGYTSHFLWSLIYQSLCSCC